jgi:class 3 adenylate cyclase
MFLDIRNFTAFAERARPREVVAQLNGLWELVVPVLLSHGGHANKFIGDGLLGVFGTPDRHSDHADRAVAAAIEIVKVVRERFAGRVAVGIGVNSGRVVTGTVGGGGRVDFTVIGDTVNTASRVEAATRETGDDILITEATRKLLGRDHGHFDEREPVPLKGKRETVQLWAPRPHGTIAPHIRAPASVAD